MIYLLFDASAVVPFYSPKSENQTKAIAYLMARKANNEAFFYIPSFCIAEVHNTLAKNHYRLGLSSKPEFADQKTKFVDHIKNGKLFYCYYMNRYHNIISEEIASVEHQNHTEYLLTGIKPNPNLQISDIEAALGKAGYDSKIGKYYLSGLDILIIAMAMELKKLHGKHKVAIVSRDHRLIRITDTIKDSGINALNLDDGNKVFEKYFDIRLRKGVYKDLCIKCEKETAEKN